MTTQHIQSITCSPRAGGNSDTAAKLFQRGAAGDAARILHLRTLSILPCISCGHCQHAPDKPCTLDTKDQAAAIFRILQEAPALHFSVPIYFYHVPAQFKALIDRAQRFWLLHQRGHTQLSTLPERKAWVTCIAARTRGESLFHGTLLTLRYFLEPFRITLQPPLLLTGLEEANALERTPETAQRVIAYGAQAARDTMEPPA